MRPIVICHMLSSLDGSLHPSRFTWSPDGSKAEWSRLYEEVHEGLEPDAWLVGRVTMAEISKVGPHAPAQVGPVERPCHFAVREAECFAIALDPSGKLHFAGPKIGGDPVVVLLGPGVADSHLAELAADGVSYIVAETAKIDLAAMLDVLGHELGIHRLLLEGGAGINGSFFAASLVNELSLLLVPALDGRGGHQGFVEAGEDGLDGDVQLSFKSCEPLAHGILHLRYIVAPR
ncbi:RibD family protein [Bosea sp. 2YAB26]|uniref:RibD family protein n=1 Tax=Bosea sp. 2YAB26 TaxID=3237478 RepID=UPI003F93C5B6